MRGRLTGMQAFRSLRLVVMGTGPFAVPMFEALRKSPHQIVAVVTRPDRAAPATAAKHY